MDICRWNVLNANETISFRWIIVVMIYMATIILCLSSDSLDERTSLVINTQSNSSSIGVNEMVRYTNYSPFCCVHKYFFYIILLMINPFIDLKQERGLVQNIWSPLSLAKSVAAIIGWILIGLRPTEDNLYDQLTEMEKYRIRGNWLDSLRSYKFQKYINKLMEMKENQKPTPIIIIVIIGINNIKN